MPNAEIANITLPLSKKAVYFCCNKCYNKVLRYTDDGDDGYASLC